MRLLCLHCATEQEISDDKISADEEWTGCPGCGDLKHVPANLDDTVTVTLTRHELRILTFWADGWARSHAGQEGAHAQRCIRTIVDRLATQTDAALTMSQEIADLRAAFPASEVTVHRDDGSEVDL
jgi:hypothetical protein